MNGKLLAGKNRGTGEKKVQLCPAQKCMRER